MTLEGGDMSTRIKIIVTLVALAAVAVSVPLAAASRANDSRLVIGIRLDFDSPTHAAGTFAACCAVNDDGAAEAQVLSFVPKGDKATFEATNTFSGQKGSFTILLSGVTGPLASDRHIARAQWRVIDGSGAYAQLGGEGQLTAVTDETNGFLTAIANGEGHGAGG
jgi:hypothetical protein